MKKSPLLVGLRGLSERASMELEGSGCREEHGERLKYSRAFLGLDMVCQPGPFWDAFKPGQVADFSNEDDGPRDL